MKTISSFFASLLLVGSLFLLSGCSGPSVTIIHNEDISLIAGNEYTTQKQNPIIKFQPSQILENQKYFINGEEHQIESEIVNYQASLNEGKNNFTFKLQNPDESTSKTDFTVFYESPEMIAKQEDEARKRQIFEALHHLELKSIRLAEEKYPLDGSNERYWTEGTLNQGLLERNNSLNIEEFDRLYAENRKALMKQSNISEEELEEIENEGFIKKWYEEKN